MFFTGVVTLAIAAVLRDTGGYVCASSSFIANSNLKSVKTA